MTKRKEDQPVTGAAILERRGLVPEPAAPAEAALQRATAWLQPADGPVTHSRASDGPGTISPGWPTEPDDTMRPPRAAVLEAGT